ncbi:MAG: Ig-like domain-containing protein [Syntrophomonadaceae bacterium]|nr:Ig-like domain-containing protein [Syntrophomonadaceae bacterium]MDD4550362.1 Ig-like domain-containing protein [Syntrophomonadaceae bacterium]
MKRCIKDRRHRHRRPRPCDHHRDHDHCPDLKRPLVLISSIPRNGQTDVSPNIKAIKLIFGRDFDNDRGWVNVCNEFDMWQGSNKVPIRIKRGIDKCDGHRVIKIIPINPLRGGVTYKVRVKSFFVDQHGERFKRFKLIVFTTRCR